MVLVISNREDITTDWLVLELQRRGAAYVRFNTEDYPQRCGLHWTPDSSYLEVGGSAVAAEEIHAVWYRRPVLPRVAPGLSAQDAAWATREAAEALDGFWRTLNARWVSPPSAIRLAGSKLLQLRDAVGIGFEIPETLVSASASHVEELLARSPVGVICKPLSDGRVRSEGRSLLFTSLITREDLVGLGDEPHLFQALVAKRYDVRVTVIGDEVFATRIEPRPGNVTAVDWRRMHPDTLCYHPETLPDALAAQCRQLLKHYRLSFGAIDLARGHDGSYTFFEVNPNGQWAFIEQRTGQPLRAALADLLTGDE